MKISPTNQACRYLGLPPAAAEALRSPRTWQYVDVLLGEIEGKLDTEGCIPANSTVVLKPATGPIKARKYDLSVEVNPDLYADGIPLCPHFVTPDDPDQADIVVTFHSKRKVDPKQLKYLFRIVVITNSI